MSVLKKLFGGKKLKPGEVRCPRCKHAFEPPRLTIVSQDIINKYGSNPVQCPKCKNIWNRE